MSDEPRGLGLRLVGGQGADDDTADSRVTIVLEVLAGEPEALVADRWSVEPALVRRWVRAFVAAGTSEVTNRPREDAARQRDRFLTAFAHELRSPLTVAQGWAAVLDDDDDLPPSAVSGIVGKLSTALDRLAERTLDVELLGTASLGRLRLAKETTTVAEVAAGLDIGTVDGLVDHEIVVDPLHFQRVLRDLWWAAGLAPEPRTRRVEVAVTGPWIEVRVHRDAEPIEPQVLQALFDPFDVNDDATGVTIGLYLARALVVAHGGSIGIEQDDNGAVLWVRIPQHRGRRSVTPGSERPTP